MGLQNANAFLSTDAFFVFGHDKCRLFQTYLVIFSRLFPLHHADYFPTLGSKTGHLWQFLLELLCDARFSPRLIKWENRSQGIFRIVNSTAVANLWGQKKNNPNMNYEKLSRAIRWDLYQIKDLGLFLYYTVKSDTLNLVDISMSNCTSSWQVFGVM